MRSIPTRPIRWLLWAKQSNALPVVNILLNAVISTLSVEREAKERKKERADYAKIHIITV